MKKPYWIIIGILASIIGIYPILYFLIDRKFGLLSSKSAELLSDNFWNMAFYGHIVLGGMALFIGWLQFSHKLRIQHVKLHRTVGKIYMIAVSISATCGIYIAWYATGGLMTMLGFLTLAIIWLSTTILGFIVIKKGQIELHEKCMLFSYAACFAAVTLRVWLPILIIIMGEFTSAYRIVAWLCWVPNIMVAYVIILKKKPVA